MARECHVQLLSRPSEASETSTWCNPKVLLGIQCLSHFSGLFTANDVQQILQEVVKMQDFSHPHVMSLIGVCLDAGVGVVMPYMANGSVLTYVKKERETLLLSDEAEIEQVCLQEQLEFTTLT